MAVFVTRPVKEVCGEINTLLEKEGIKQVDLIKESGIHEATFKKIIGANNYPSFESLSTLCNYFNVSADQFVFGQSHDYSDVIWDVAENLNKLDIEDQEEIEKVVQVLVDQKIAKYRSRKRSITRTRRQRVKSA